MSNHWRCSIDLDVVLVMDTDCNVLIRWIPFSAGVPMQVFSNELHAGGINRSKPVLPCISVNSEMNDECAWQESWN